MFRFKILPNGFSAAYVSDHKRTPGKRDICQGWTDSSARGNRYFLKSVLRDELTGDGFAVTLTVRDCPSSAADWTRVRNRFIHRLRRLGMVRLHWLTEWQRRGVPHLHAMVYFPTDHPIKVGRWGREFSTLAGPHYPRLIKGVWEECAREYRPARHCQTVREIYDSLGWLEYEAKHGARGVANYQRASFCIPDGWKGSTTGRMWGRCGDWPVGVVVEGEWDSRRHYWETRRYVKRWVLSQARSAPTHRARARGIRFARTMYQVPRDLSEVMGIDQFCSDEDLLVRFCDQARLSLARKFCRRP